MRRRLLLALITSGIVLSGPLAGSAAAASYGPYPSLDSCNRSAGNLEMHGYDITIPCRRAYPGVNSWYFSAVYA